MNENNKIRSLFDKLRPIIINKLLNPDDIYVRSGGTQLIITLNAEKAESVTTKEVFTAIPSDYPNIWYVCPDKVTTKK